jgi:hypothetical protein
MSQNVKFMSQPPEKPENTPIQRMSSSFRRILFCSSRPVGDSFATGKRLQGFTQCSNQRRSGEKGLEFRLQAVWTSRRTDAFRLKAGLQTLPRPSHLRFNLSPHRSCRSCYPVIKTCVHTGAHGWQSGPTDTEADPAPIRGGYIIRGKPCARSETTIEYRIPIKELRTTEVESPPSTFDIPCSLLDIQKTAPQPPPVKD